MNRFIRRMVRPALAGLMFVAAQAGAAEPKMLGAFDTWSAHLYADGKNRICYVHATPKKSEGGYAQRGRTYVQVTHRTADGVRNEISVTAGYPYKAGSEVKLEIDGHVFALFTRNDGAWTRDAQADQAVVAAMKAGKTMIIRGVSSRGTETTDTYSLIGFTAAHSMIDKACKPG